MGKCFSCYEAPQPEGSPHRNSLERGGRTELTDPTIVEKLTECARIPTPISIDSQTNGNGKLGSIKTGNSTSSESTTRSETKRMFYSRIPPLGRTGSADGKRFGSTKEVSETKINSLFDQYKEPYEDVMLAEGIERFCADLEVKPDEFSVLVLAWKFLAQQMCRFTRAEFLEGCRTLRADSIKGIQSKIPEMVAEVQHAETFKDFYRFTFKFGLDSDVGQRNLPVDMAVSLWQLVFSQKEPTILQRWLKFLDKHPHVRSIPRDTWFMFLNFVDAVGNDLSSYDDTEAWPSLFDDFVEYENDQMNQNISKAKNEYREESD